jgi:hypothetical protein
MNDGVRAARRLGSQKEKKGSLIFVCSIFFRENSRGFLDIKCKWWDHALSVMLLCSHRIVAKERELVVNSALLVGKRLQRINARDWSHISCALPSLAQGAGELRWPHCSLPSDIVSVYGSDALPCVKNYELRERIAHIFRAFSFRRASLIQTPFRKLLTK